MNTEFYVGVDVGSLRDYTAICVVRQRFVVVGDWREAMYRNDLSTARARYELIYLNQLPVGTDYPRIVDEIHRVTSRPEIPRPQLVVDSTGVGRPVIDMLSDRGLSPIGVTITGGANVHESVSGYSVPKRDLVSALQVGLHTGALRIAGDLRMARDFQNQLAQFTPKPTRSGNSETYEAIRESVHDDMVLSVGLAVWYAQHMGSRIELSSMSYVETFDPLAHEKTRTIDTNGGVL